MVKNQVEESFRLTLSIMIVSVFIAATPSQSRQPIHQSGDLLLHNDHDSWSSERNGIPLELLKIVRQAAFSGKMTSRGRPKSANLHSGDRQEPLRTLREDPCDREDTNGCSVPYGLPFFYKELFTPTCNRHDICYSCGVAFSHSRADCDDAFRKDMSAACDTLLSLRMSSHPTTDSTMDSTRLHLKLMRGAVAKLQGQFRDVLRSEMGPSFMDQDGATAGRGRDSSKMRRFQEQANAVRDAVIKTWAKLLYREMYFDFNQSSSHNGRVKNDVFYSSSYSTSSNDVLSKSKKSNSVVSSRVVIQNVISRHHGDIDSIIRTHCWPKHENISSTYATYMKHLCEDVLIYVGKQTSTFYSSPLLNLGSVEILFCQFIKELYYWAVFFFGDPRYSRQAYNYCGDSWVQDCLPSD